MIGHNILKMVPEAGLEPARYFYRGILSPLCLPIPPLGQIQLSISCFNANYTLLLNNCVYFNHIKITGG